MTSPKYKRIKRRRMASGRVVNRIFILALSGRHLMELFVGNFWQVTMMGTGKMAVSYGQGMLAVLRVSAGLQLLHRAYGTGYDNLRGLAHVCKHKEISSAVSTI